MRTSLPLVVLLVGCASTDDGPQDHVDLVSTPYTLQPGEEKYWCYAMRLPADRDIAITKMTPTYGPGTHHILFSQTLATEPDGFSECNVLIRTTWVPLYAGGVDSGALVLPENTGFQPLERGQQILMQLHLQNASDEPMTGKTSMRVDFVDKTPELKAAGIYGLDNRKLSIPAGQTATSSMACTMSRDMEVFAVLGHMHKHGISLDVSRGATAGTDMLYEEVWNFEEQPVTPISFRVNRNDQLHLRCTHKNNGAAPVIYGESSETEMCAFLMYYAPAPAVDGCINE